MAKLNLWHSSCRADEGCIVYCKSQANVLMATSCAKLFRITTNADKVHYVWRDSPDDFEYEFPIACRAFIEPPDMLEDDIFDVKLIQEIVPEQDIFCFNGYIYYLHRKKNGNLIVRRINAYSSQKIIEQMISEDYHDIEIENVYFSNFYVVEAHGRKYVMTCWGIVYQDGFLYVPIFDEDRHFIYDRPIESYMKEEIPVGKVFMANKMYYQIAQDEENKFCLNYSRSPFLFAKDAQKKPVSKQNKAIIVRMSANKKNNG